MRNNKLLLKETIDSRLLRFYHTVLGNTDRLDKCLNYYCYFVMSVTIKNY